MNNNFVAGGILPPDDCLKNFIGKKNESKHFVCTNDEELRNELRNLGTVPIFFFKNGILVMDAPTEITEEKHRMKEMLKNEPTRQEKVFLKEQQEEIKEFQKMEREKEIQKRKQKEKELYCMGIKTKLAKGPNPLSMRKKRLRIDENGQEYLKKRRVRKGKRSKDISLQKRQKTDSGQGVLTQGENWNQVGSNSD